jgi:prophage tail gpP-like protein
MTDDVSIRLSSDRMNTHTVLSGWQQVRVTVGIERVPPDFEITYTERIADGTTSVAAPGQICQISIGSDAVITGYIDRVIETISEGEHQLTLTGRGQTQDLVDCAAIWQGATFQNVDPYDLAADICLPYDVVPVLQATSLKRLPQFMISLGETAYGVIERICRLSGLLAFEGTEGELLLTRTGAGLAPLGAAAMGKIQAASGFQQGVNVQRASYERSMDQRFSVYTVVYSGNQLLGDAGASPLTTYSYTDAGVPRLRQKYIELLTNDAGSTFAQSQAIWEMNRRIGRSYVVRVTADSWRDQGGTLWTPNTLATVDIPSIKVSRTPLLISEVTFSRTLDGGTTADLILMPAQAFGVEPLLYTPIPGDIAAAEQALNP